MSRRRTYLKSIAAGIGVALTGGIGTVDAADGGDASGSRSDGTTWVTDVRFGLDVSDFGGRNTRRFGSEVALSGDTAFATSVGYGPAKVYEMRRSGGTWGQPTEIVNDDEDGNVGEHVSLDGDTALVSGGDDAVSVYFRDSSGWSKTATLDDGNINYSLESTALSGDTALVGAPRDPVDSVEGDGLAYVFELTGGGWTRTETFLPPDVNRFENFGRDVALSGTGDRALVCGGGSDARNVVRFYVRNSGSWSREDEITADEGVRLETAAMSDDGSTAVVGGTIPPERALVLTRRGSDWSLQREFTPPDGGPSEFGSAVDLDADGDTLLIGAGSADSLAPNAGAVYERSSRETVTSILLANQQPVNDGPGVRSCLPAVTGAVLRTSPSRPLRRDGDVCPLRE